MRILFVSNMFPPYARGGYEQWCEEVALALAARGHALCILTAQAGPAGAPDVDAGQPFPIHRLLHTEVEGGLGSTTLRLLRGTAQVEQANLGHVDTVVQHFQPDAGLATTSAITGLRCPMPMSNACKSRRGGGACNWGKPCWLAASCLGWPRRTSPCASRIPSASAGRCATSCSPAALLCAMPR